MNIYDPYPDRIETQSGHVYRVNLAYDRVLKCLDTDENEPGLTIGDRLIVKCAWLLDEKERIPDDPAEQAQIVNAVFDLLPKGENTGERYLDFHQDAAMIRSAFFRIGVDLTKQKIHFFQFLELLADLPKDTALMRTIEIRQRPIPNATKDNAEQIAALLKAKERVALKVSEEERRHHFMESLKK
jgi:hypothetical protein